MKINLKNNYCLTKKEEGNLIINKVQYMILILFASILLFLIPNISNATVSVTKNIYANNGSAKYTFTGLTLDKSHEYEFALTKTSAQEAKNWYLITEYTETTAIIDIIVDNTEFRNVITSVDTGYITIRDKTAANKIVVNPHAIDLSIPYLNITNYTVISNGKSLDGENKIQINFWGANNSNAYYQYEKITDEKVINKYKEIKAENGNFNDLQSLLKTNAPTSNWSKWGYWNRLL